MLCKRTSPVLMAINSKYLFVVSIDADSNKEALFNDIYDTEHIPNLLKVPGVRGVTRMAGQPFTMSTRPAGPVARAAALRHDALQTELACVLEYDRAVVPVQFAGRGRRPYELRQFQLAELDRLAPHIPPVELQEVERKEKSSLRRCRSISKTGVPVSSKQTASPSMRNDL